MHVRTYLVYVCVCVCVCVCVFTVWFAAVLGHFKHHILRYSLAKTITAPHLNFVVKCEVRCSSVYKVRFGQF